MPLGWAFFLLEPHPKMPNMQLSRSEAADLAAYIATLNMFDRLNGVRFLLRAYEPGLLRPALLGNVASLSVGSRSTYCAESRQPSFTKGCVESWRGGGTG